MVEASSKYGATLVPGPVLFVLEKVSTFVVTEEPAKGGEKPGEGEETSGVKEKEIVAEKEKKEEEVAEKNPETEAAKEEPEPPKPCSTKKKSGHSEEASEVFCEIVFI